VLLPDFGSSRLPVHRDPEDSHQGSRATTRPFHSVAPGLGLQKEVIGTMNLHLRKGKMKTNFQKKNYKNQKMVGILKRRVTRKKKFRSSSSSSWLSETPRRPNDNTRLREASRGPALPAVVDPELLPPLPHHRLPGHRLLMPG
jgi:hypothetical protein